MRAPSVLDVITTVKIVLVLLRTTAALVRMDTGLMRRKEPPYRFANNVIQLARLVPEEIKIQIVLVPIVPRLSSQLRPPQQELAPQN